MTTTDTQSRIGYTLLRILNADGVDQGSFSASDLTTDLHDAADKINAYLEKCAASGDPRDANLAMNLGPVIDMLAEMTADNRRPTSGELIAPAGWVRIIDCTDDHDHDSSCPMICVPMTLDLAQRLQEGIEIQAGES